MLEIGMVHKTLLDGKEWFMKPCSCTLMLDGILCGPKLVCQIIQLPQEVPLPMLQMLHLPFKPDVYLLCNITSGSFSQGA